MKEIRLKGIACPWDKLAFVAYSPFPRRFARGAFRAGFGQVIPFRRQIKLEHGVVMPTIRGVRLEETTRGLECTFCVTPGQSRIVDGVLLALRHGHFPGLSVGIEELRVTHQYRDGFGRRIRPDFRGRNWGSFALRPAEIHRRHLHQFCDRPAALISGRTQVKSRSRQARSLPA